MFDCQYGLSLPAPQAQQNPLSPERAFFIVKNKILLEISAKALSTMFRQHIPQVLMVHITKFQLDFQ
jgi:hypothetical protein